MASISDKITKVKDGSNPNVARVVTPRPANSDTLSVDSLTGWSEDTAMHFMTYRVDSTGKVVPGSQRDWKGMANKATGQIISLEIQNNAIDDGNLVGDIVQAGPTASWAQDLAEAMLESHKTDGSLKKGAVGAENIAKDSITAESIKEKSITADKIDSTTILSYKNNDSNKPVTGNVIIQSGWVYFLGNGGKQQSVQVTFPKKFKEVYAVIPTLIGYTFKTPTSPASFDQKIGAGTNIECGAFNQTGTTITASTSGIFGGANHGISWIAVGTVQLLNIL